MDARVMDLVRWTAGDGTSLAYQVAGPVAGDMVVLCHGLCAGGAQFADDATYLANQGYRVLVPDLRGHGNSGVPEDTSADTAFSPERLELDMTSMLDHAGAGRVHWVGNSLGGIIGLGLAARHRQRLASLTLFGTALALNLPAIVAPAIAWFDRVPGREISARITAITTTGNRAARPLVTRMLRRYDARAAAGMAAHIRRYDLTKAALDWSGPGLVLVGGRDHAVNRVLLPQLGLLAERPNWLVKELPLGGHCANLDAGAAWRAALLMHLRHAAA